MGGRGAMSVAMGFYMDIFRVTKFFLASGTFVCYDLRPDMFQSQELAVVIAPPLEALIQIVCVLTFCE